MNTVKIFFLFVLINVCVRNSVSYVDDDDETWKNAKSVYEFTVKDIRGNDVPMSNYSGKMLLIVNLSPKCELMDTAIQELNALYKKYSSQGLEILAFPGHLFMSQVSNTNEEIYKFAKYRKVKFHMFEKIKINGDETPPLWKYLKTQKKFLMIQKDIVWNNTKFIVNRNGKVINRISPINILGTEKYLKPYFNRDKANDKRNRK